MGEAITIKALVAAPNARIYDTWLSICGRDRAEYPYLSHSGFLHDYWGPIIVLNGGPIYDPDLLSRIRHPARAGNLTYLMV